MLERFVHLVTSSLKPGFGSLGVLDLVNLIQIFLSISFGVGIQGRLPWRRTDVIAVLAQYQSKLNWILLSNKSEKRIRTNKRRSSTMKYLFKAQAGVAGLLILGAPITPALAGAEAGAPILLAQMMPMPPQGSPGAGPGMPNGMRGMQPQLSPGGGASMAPPHPQGPPGAVGMPGGMEDDKMGKPAQNAASPGGGMPGMQPPGPPASPGGMAGAGNGMMPMPPAMMSMMESMMAQMGKMQPPAAAPLDHVEGRIGFLKAELGITEAQTQTWDQFAQALRTSREHLAEARQALVSSMGDQTGAPGRLQAYEHHLSMRLDSLRAARESFERLYPLLSPAQQKHADELVVPLLVSF